MGLRGYDNPRQFSDLLSGQDCTLRKIVEGIFRIGIAIQLQVHLRIVRLQLKGVSHSRTGPRVFDSSGPRNGKNARALPLPKSGRALASIRYLRRQTLALCLAPTVISGVGG